MSDRMPILTYHSIDDTGSVLSTHPDTFAQHMACLADLGIRGVHLSEVVRYLQLEGRWPERSVAISFDDGYANNLRVAQPILARFNFTATIYLITRHVGGQHDWEVPPAGLGRRNILDWAQVRELKDAGWEIGAHTRTHPDLRKLTPSAIEAEILGSRSDIEERLSGRVESFAYPGGFLSEAASAVVAREFQSGCTTLLQCARADTPLHCLPRVEMYYLRDPKRLRELLAGKLDAFLGVRRLARRVRSAFR